MPLPKGVVDADAHVDETDETWEYMPEAEREFKPITFDPGKAIVPGDRRPHAFWLVDGRLGLRRWRDDERTGTTAEQRQLLDVPSRIRHMDELGIDFQVIYPTYLLGAPSPRPENELAIYRSYNRWLADKCAGANGRLRWVIMPPIRTMDQAIEELRWGKEHGACGVFKRAIECGGKGVEDPFFFPLYEEAQRLDLPMCVHVGSEDFNANLFSRAGAGFGARPQIGVFPNLAAKGIPDKFPELRFGVIEAMASWLPHVIADLRAKDLYSGRLKTYADSPFNLTEDFMKSNRFYVTCQTSDDVPYLLNFGAEDSLMVGTDYSHDDQSGVIAALEFIQKLGEQEEMPTEAAHKILVDNPRSFYGL